jgi:phosphate/sulfate permease
MAETDDGKKLAAIFMFVSPIIGLIFGFLFMVAVLWVCRRSSKSKIDRYFKRLQLFSAGSIASVTVQTMHKKLWEWLILYLSRGTKVEGADAPITTWGTREDKNKFIQEMINAGMDINYKHGCLLAAAIQSNDNQLVDIIMQAPRLKLVQPGRNFLVLALISENLRILQALLSRMTKDQINEKIGEGVTPYLVARYGQSREPGKAFWGQALEALKKAGAQVDLREPAVAHYYLYSWVPGLPPERIHEECKYPH